MSLRDPSGFLWEEAVELLDRAQRMQRLFFRLQALQHQRPPAWEPPVDVFEHGDTIVVLAALPGVLPGQIEVALEGASLVMRGERTLPAACSARIRRLELPHGDFERRIELPSEGYRIAQQTLADGCLGLTLERLTRSSPP